jgi:transposase-like protein
MMECPECKSSHIRKNGHRGEKQNHLCVDCGRQFVENPKTERGYSDEVRKICLKMAVNGIGFRGIERVTGIHHTTVINWIKQVGKMLPDAYDPENIPKVGELDELQAFVGSKKTSSGFGQ